MITITDKSQCSGCSACYSVCPKGAITMQPDEEGFLYPVVDNKCVDCGLCDKVCPINSSGNDTELPKNAFAIRTKNDKFLKECASGGFFTQLSQHILKNNGVVYGAAYGENNEVVHTVAEKEAECLKFSSSKYVQSKIGDTFKNVKEDLNSGRTVCFSGTPCQVEGLLNFLGRDYANLITVDMVCHGVPSPFLWEKYIESMEKKYKSKVINANFRKKTYGYQSGLLELVFENGKVYYGSKRNDAMVKSFFTEISSRMSCYECAFKKAKHKSDFTMFDCWHAAELVQGLKDDDKGFTNLLVNTDKGINILTEFAESFEMYEVDIEKAIALDGVMVRKSAKMHPCRTEYYKAISENSLKFAIQKYIPITKKDEIIVSFRSVLYKLGILNTMRKLVKKL